MDALIIAAAAPLFAATAFIPQRIWRWRLRSWQHGTIRLAVTALPLVIVLAQAIHDMQKQNTDGEEAAYCPAPTVQLAVAGTAETIARSCSELYSSTN